MENALLAPHQDCQTLKKVIGRFLHDEDISGPPLLLAIMLVFERSSVVLAATDEDEVAIGIEMPPNTPGTRDVDLSCVTPWKDAIGESLLWSWTMTNQQGYLDGVQLEFARNVETRSVTVQLIAAGSTLRVGSVRPDCPR